MMKLKDQVVSLEIAKKLKEIGVNQESLFYWVSGSSESPEHQLVYIKPYSRDDRIFLEKYSAFTASEIGDLFPDDQIIDIAKMMKVNYTDYRWRAINLDHDDHCTFDNTLVNCMAKMLIYLIENKLIEVSNA